MQAEDLLYSGQRRQFLRCDVGQLGIGKTLRQGTGDLPPAQLQERQGVERERVEETTAGIEVVLQHPGDPAFSRRNHRGTEHIPKRMGLVGGHREHPETGARITDRGGSGQRRLAYPALSDKETDPQSGGRC